MQIKKARLSVHRYFDLLRNVRKQFMVITLRSTEVDIGSYPILLRCHFIKRKYQAFNQNQNSY